MGEEVVGNERKFRPEPEKRGILSRIAGGVVMLFAGLGLGGAALFAVVLVAIAFIAELILIGILTVYILTFANGIFIDATLFAADSIFTIPYTRVIEIGASNPWAFWGVYIIMFLSRASKRSSNKKKECALH